MKSHCPSVGAPVGLSSDSTAPRKGQDRIWTQTYTFYRMCSRRLRLLLLQCRGMSDREKHLLCATLCLDGAQETNKKSILPSRSQHESVVFQKFGFTLTGTICTNFNILYKIPFCTADKEHFPMNSQRVFI